jgi:UDP-glucose:(heptosyl)LPS alpha-1,3-glucosyltransferase
MKVALVILHADPARGGAERYTVDLASALHARGVDVTLAASTFGPDEGGPRLPLRVEARTRLGYYDRFIDRFMRVVYGKFDVIHAMLPLPVCDVYHPHAGLAVESLMSGYRKYDGLMRPLTAITNRFNRKRRRFASVERELLTHPDAPVVLCLSEYVKATVREHYPDLPAACLATLFNAVDLVRFDPAARADAGRDLRRRLGIDKDCAVALMIAQDYQRKGLAEAIEALPPAESRMVLLVVGKQDAGAYRKLAHDRGYGDRVIFAGPTSDPYSFYQGADLFVLPTRHDPCSLVVLEALAMGVPVISTRYNGACEIMSDGVHGFVLNDPRDVSALRNRYEKLLDPEARRRMRAACLDLRPRLSQERHVDRVVDVYRAILAEQNTPSRRQDTPLTAAASESPHPRRSPGPC